MVASCAGSRDRIHSEARVNEAHLVLLRAREVTLKYLHHLFIPSFALNERLQFLALADEHVLRAAQGQSCPLLQAAPSAAAVGCEVALDSRVRVASLWRDDHEKAAAARIHRERVHRKLLQPRVFLRNARVVHPDEEPCRRYVIGFAETREREHRRSIVHAVRVWGVFVQPLVADEDRRRLRDELTELVVCVEDDATPVPARPQGLIRRYLAEALKLLEALEDGREAHARDELRGLFYLVQVRLLAQAFSQGAPV
mmetsp:Transcript_24976/g.73350  ORF Transcript_24976/g.73350 Transcript_24976/m.73350 type:complete len:255 (+) Transcript_24976:474-1238(+)